MNEPNYLSELILQHPAIFGFLASGVLALLAYRFKSLSISGSITACLLGGLIFSLGGWSWASLLLLFFLSSSFLSRLFAGKKKPLAEKFEKGSQRDWAQVLANGGLGGLLVSISYFLPDNALPFIAYAGALATVNADTWATELGVLSATKPRLITTGKQVSRGTSGGISLVGTAASLAGAIVIAGAAAYFDEHPLGALRVILLVTVGGFSGALLDSLLGATVQAIYYDPSGNKVTERKIHNSQGLALEPLRGKTWMNNDMVNFLSSGFGALFCVVLWKLIF